jgi:hypothetical protein
MLGVSKGGRPYLDELGFTGSQKVLLETGVSVKLENEDAFELDFFVSFGFDSVHSTCLVETDFGPVGTLLVVISLSSPARVARPLDKVGNHWLMVQELVSR